MFFFSLLSVYTACPKTRFADIVKCFAVIVFNFFRFVIPRTWKKFWLTPVLVANINRHVILSWWLHHHHYHHHHHHHHRHHHHHHWFDSPLWAPAFLRSFAHSSLSRANFFQFLTPNILMFWSTPSTHRNFSLPSFLAPSGLVLNILVYTHQVTCPCQSFNFDVSNDVWFVKCFI